MEKYAREKRNRRTFC